MDDGPGGRRRLKEHMHEHGLTWTGNSSLPSCPLSIPALGMSRTGMQGSGMGLSCGSITAMKCRTLRGEGWLVQN
jgi:hypothetical protein